MYVSTTNLLRDLTVWRGYNLYPVRFKIIIGGTELMLFKAFLLESDGKARFLADLCKSRIQIHVCLYIAQDGGWKFPHYNLKFNTYRFRHIQRDVITTYYHNPNPNNKKGRADCSFRIRVRVSRLSRILTATSNCSVEIFNHLSMHFCGVEKYIS